MGAVTPECVVCGTDVSVSDACPHCGATCCRDHRDPDAHDCPGTTAGATAGWHIDLDLSGDGNTTDGDPDHAEADDETPSDECPAADSDATGENGDDSLRWLLRPGVGLAVATLLIVAVALGAVAYAGPLDGELVVEEVEFHIEEQTNEERTAAGLQPAEHDADLAAVAREHSRDMRDRGFVDHTNPDGEDPADRVAAAGFECLPGENIYQAPRGGLATSERALADHVVRSWLNSEGHRETLLRYRYDRQGVGVAVGEDAVYVTQVFC